MKTAKLFLIALVTFIGTQFTNAQSKIAHVDVQDIITNMPAMKDAQKQLEQLSKTYEGEMKVMIEEFQKKLGKYQEEAETVDDKTNEARTKEMEDMDKRIKDYRSTAQKDISDKEEALMKPIYDKVRASIEKVGKAKGFEYVFDKTSALLANGTNITADVKKDLGF
ncbi:MAG: OmpH family outer membrane protein [Flavobacteriales bacterium]|nr:OmpH family outer membrane protein [Flavobacteriales bacterium]